VTAGLPSVLGSLAALAVGAASLSAGVAPETLVLRTCSAFTVFAAFGIVIRHLLGDQPGAATGEGVRGEASNPMDAEQIRPGTPVGELLEEGPDQR